MGVKQTKGTKKKIDAYKEEEAMMWKDRGERGREDKGGREGRRREEGWSETSLRHFFLTKKVKLK